MRRKLVSAIDGIRNLHLKTGDEEEYELEVEEKAAAQHFALANIVRHGFPDDPRCMAFDPVQRLLAIGGGRGNVRLLGQAGVDYYLKHDSDEPVLFAQFLVNEGGLITGLRDDTIHLWNYRQKTPEIVHSLKMAKERVTCVHLPFQSKWLHVGTDKGNVYFICLATFELSTYVINWNKAIDISCRTHPGCVKELSLCPSEPHRLLILYEKGHVVVWNLVNKEVERFAIENSPAKCIAWHHDGRQLMCGHKDGSLTIWNIKKPKELVHKTTPHSPNDSNACRPITHLSWNVTADGEQIIVFAGGMAADEGVLPALTVLRNKGSITVLEMDHNIVEMCALNSLPFNTVPQLPYGIAVLLKEDLLVIDSTMPGYPCFESPYPTDIHESTVTYLAYYADCPVDLIAALTLVGRNQRRQGVRLSEKPWPINGGVGRECATGQQEILLTGHEDGSIKFWQASSENLQVMYKLKTGRHFEKASSSDDVPQKAVISHAVTGVELCLDSRLLLVAGASGQVSLFRFVKTESCQDVAVVILPQLCSSTAAPNTPPLPNTEEDSQQQHLKPQRGASVSGTSTPRSGGLRRQADTSSSSRDSHSTDTSSGSQVAEQLPIKVRGGALRRPAGYQPELVCQIPWIGGLTPEKVTAMALNSAYGIIAIGTQSGIALVDIIASTQIYAWSNAELHDRPSVPLPVHLPASANSNATPPEAPSPQERLTHRRMQLKPNNARSFSPLLARKPPPPRPPPPRLTIPNQQACSSSAQFCAVTPRLPHRQMSVPHSPHTNYVAHSVDVQIDRKTRRKANSSSCGNQIQPAHPGELENRDIARPNGLKLFPMSRSDSSSRDQLSTPGTPTSTHLATPPLLDLILTEEEEEYTDSTSECFTPPCSPSLTPTPESALRASSSFNQLSHLDIPQPLVQSRSSSELNDDCIDNQIDRHRFASFNPSNPRKNSTSQHLAVSGRSNSLKMAATVVRKFTGKVRLGRSLSVQQKCTMHQSHHSSMTPPPNSAPVKSFMRLNTECGKQRSVERHSRPLLSKAQSMAVSYVTGTSGYNNGNNLAEPSQSNNSPLGDNCNGDLTNATENNTSHVSRSSSANSLEKLASQDCVTSLTFINCSSKKGSSKSEPCLWLGTSKGACVAFNLILPNDRIISNVVVAPSGSVIRLQERILYSTFLNRSLCIIMGAAEIYKDSSKESAPTSANIDKALQNKIITKPSLAPTQLTNQQENGGSTTCPPAEDFSHLGVFVSEEEIRVIGLPGYTQFFHFKPDIPFVKAKSSHVRGYPVLMCLNAAGHVQVLTLPSLKMLYQTPLFRCSVDWDDPICQKTDFSEHGLGMYMASPTEVQKFTINSELAAQVAECAGELFVPCDMPEPPKASFFRGVSTLFASSGQRDNVDLDSIFSEKPSTTAVSSMKSIARQIPSSSLTTNSLPLNNMEATNSRNISAGQAATMAIQNLNERGERLNAVVDATENLRNNAMNMYSRSSKLVEKYEKKKWYQL